MPSATDVAGSASEYAAELERHSVNFPGLTSEQIIHPKKHRPVTHFWRWVDLERLLVQSAEIQDVLPQGEEGAERRIIRLKNPGVEVETVTDTMSVSLQYILPGEVARAHRHTPNAFRFFLRGNAYTTVSGEKNVMSRGDLVITPFMEWHDHGNESKAPAMWMDGLDYPLVRYLESVIYERPKEQRQPIDHSGLSERRYSGVGLRPGWNVDDNPALRSLLHFRWETTERVLNELAQADDVSPHDDVILEFVNPATGRSAFNTIACCIQLIRPGVRTQAHRHTGQAVYHAFEGEGEVVIDGETHTWQQGDFFVLPHLVSHQFANTSKERALLFSIQDFPTLRALGLYREETD